MLYKAYVYKERIYSLWVVIPVFFLFIMFEEKLCLEFENVNQQLFYATQITDNVRFVSLKIKALKGSCYIKAPITISHVYIFDVEKRISILLLIFGVYKQNTRCQRKLCSVRDFLQTTLMKVPL